MSGVGIFSGLLSGDLLSRGLLSVIRFQEIGGHGKIARLNFITLSVFTYIRTYMNKFITRNIVKQSSNQRRFECCLVFYRFGRGEEKRVFSPWQVKVRLGAILASDSDPDAVMASVSKVTLYPNYNISRKIGDIGLLKLASPVTVTDTIRPICLPSPDINVNQFKVCVHTGFGSTKFVGG